MKINIPILQNIIDLHYYFVLAGKLNRQSVLHLSSSETYKFNLLKNVIVIKQPLFILTLFALLFGLSNCSESKQNQEKELYLKAYVCGELPVQHGMQLLNQHCASCHNFAENSIGPNLTGGTREVDGKVSKAIGSRRSAS